VTERSQQLVDILRRAGHEPYAYSGRGMYGKECIAVDIAGRVLDFAADVFDAIDDADGEGISPVSKAFRSACTDSMGTSTVVYFPKFATTEAELPR
jgi:hypothetical protein